MFLCCAVFPKDIEVDKDLLVKLWMAEGSLGSGRMDEREHVGEDHFDNMHCDRFFQILRKTLMETSQVAKCMILSMISHNISHMADAQITQNLIATKFGTCIAKEIGIHHFIRQIKFDT
ncbi:hypothetical protein ACHQM5_004045 [Ranunculus cassubicifolius]